MLFIANTIYDCVNMYTIQYTAKGTVAAEPYLLFNTIHGGIDHGNQPGCYLTVIQYYNAIWLSAGPVCSILSILQYITDTAMQYGYQPILSVVYYIILQYNEYITVTSQQYRTVSL